jgi:hypothetical protein
MLPTPHGVQIALFEFMYVPMEQIWQSAAVVDLEMKPSAQLMHKPPLMALYDPSLQATHVFLLSSG